jgi:hypothetical protein
MQIEEGPIIVSRVAPQNLIGAEDRITTRAERSQAVIITFSLIELQDSVL